ncbi:hypothetical protein IAT38_001929 [Cryptococcus sp. DSM 104549]
MFTTLTTLLTLLALTSASPLPPTHDLSKRYTSVRIQSNRDGRCLYPFGIYEDGTEVVTSDCYDSPTWDINPGSGSITLHGTGYALDAGTGTQNNEGLKLWTSYPGLYQQTWTLASDNTIRISGGNQCLDEGPDQKPQTYECFTGNENQIWYLLNVPTGEETGDAAAGTLVNITGA